MKWPARCLTTLRFQRFHLPGAHTLWAFRAWAVVACRECSPPDLADAVPREHAAIVVALPKEPLPLRLHPDQVNVILQTIRDNFGPDVHVWLFGSRVDEGAVGGDMDLFVESDREVPVRILLRSLAILETSLGLPVDLVLQMPGHHPGPIANIARMTGQRLT